MAWKKAKQEEVDEVEEDDADYEQMEEQVKKAVSQPMQPVPKLKPVKPTVPIQKPVTPRWGVMEMELAPQSSLVVHDSKTGQSYSLYEAVAMLLERTE